MFISIHVYIYDKRITAMADSVYQFFLKKMNIFLSLDECKFDGDDW